MYGWGHVGLSGQDYYGLLAQANLQDCDPRDSACVSNNVAKQAAVENTWLSYMANPNGAPDNLQLTFKPQSDAEVNEFYNAQNPAVGGNVVDTRGILTSNLSTPPAPVYVPPPAPAPASVPVATRTVGTSATPSTIGNATALPPSATSWALPDSASSLPWYVWAGGGVALLFAFKGGR